MRTIRALSNLGQPLAMLLTLLALAPLAGWAQKPTPPGQISFQGFLTDAAGAPLAAITPKNYDVIFRIYDSPSGANKYWTEEQTVVVDRGYFSVMFGQGAQYGSEAWSGDLTSIFLGPGASTRFVGITVKGLAATDSEIAPRLQLLSSPYAFLAANANSLVNNAGLTIISGTSGNPVFNVTNATFYGSPTFGSGLILNDSDLYLRGPGDHNHGVGWYGPSKPFADFSWDGPVLYGWSGGGLGTTQNGQNLALQWDGAGSVAIDVGNLNNGSITPGVAPGLTFGYSSGEGIASKRTAGGNQYGLDFYTYSINRMSIAGNGNVGIATTNPSMTLDVNGNTFLRAGAIIAGPVGIGTISPGYTLDVNGGFRAQGSAYLANMFVTGNMGIGTINPYAKVDIETLQEGGQSFFVNGSNSVNPVASIQNNYYSGAKASQPALVVMAKGPTDFGVLRVIRNGGPAGGIMSNWVGDNSSDVVVFYSNGAGRFAGNLTATAFNTLSDRESKEHFESIRPRDVLDKVAALPLSQWNFKTETASRHVGPMAQDFYAAFGLGQDEKHIATVDAEGVALAAIQGLNQKVDEQAAELKAKEAELQALKQSLAELKEAVARLPQAPR